MLATPLPGSAVETVEYARTFVVRHLEGTVVDGAGAPVAGVSVEVCDPGWKNCRTSTRTDEHGSFSLSSEPKQKIHYLLFSAPLFDSIRVKIHFFGGTLNLRMLVAT